MSHEEFRHDRADYPPHSRRPESPDADGSDQDRFCYCGCAVAAYSGGPRAIP
jgi:hypothetical protein